MPKITIDNKEIDFTQGQTIIQAAEAASIDIPHFCWHSALSVSGNCRVCLVEVEKMPKLVIACSTLATDGMVVSSQSEKTLSARSAVMEFILINHPLDCPICDEAGDCKLQNYTYKHSNGESRFIESKNSKDKRVALGPNVMFDGERCISCSRCIRFCDEIVGEKQLTFVKRGDRVTISTFPGKELDNDYSMNVIDICPVGALTSRDFRFTSRVWEMSSTKSICSGCSKGCNIDVWVRNNQILRLTPRQNDAVNNFWMCDEGRLNTFKHINADTRINGPQVRRDGALSKVTWDEAFSAAASELKAFSKDEIGFVGSPQATNEDNFLFSKFVKSNFGIKNLTFFKHIIPGTADSLLQKEDKSPNSFGAELAGIKPSKDGYDFASLLSAINSHKIKALYILEDSNILEIPEIESYLSKLDLLIVHSVNSSILTQRANIVFPAASYAEKNGTWINCDGIIQRIRPAVTTQEIDRSLDGFSMSRLDKFGTEYDRWNQTAKVDARPSWKILCGLMTVFGQKQKFSIVEEVFSEMSNTIPSLNGIDYSSIGDLGIKVSLKSPIPATIEGKH